MIDNEREDGMYIGKPDIVMLFRMKKRGLCRLGHIGNVMRVTQPT